MSTERLLIDDEALDALIRRYPSLGAFRRIRRNGLSINTAACIVETDRGQFFVKRADPAQRDAQSLQGEHAIMRWLNRAGFPTPYLHANEAGETLTWLFNQPYGIFDVARGEDRYGQEPVFAPFRTAVEARVAGEHLAMYHAALRRFPLPAPRPFQGITARYELMSAPSVAEGLQQLLAPLPQLTHFLAQKPALAELRQVLEVVRRELAPWLTELPVGVIHGDFIKRNLFWEGTTIADVVDFDLWNVSYWVYDLSLALLPCGFDWPAILAGQAQPRADHLGAFLNGYQSVRPLHEAEKRALPAIMETARFEFYLSAMASALGRDDAPRAELFWQLLVDTTRWFQGHPGWRQAIAGRLS